MNEVEDGPESKEPIPVRILGAMSAPRIGFMDTMVSAMHLVGMNIDFRKHSGPFWEQSLSYLLYKAVEENYDYVLTMDYDSVFDPKDIWYMLKLMINMPQDTLAVFPVQVRREGDQLLLGLVGAGDENGKVSTSIFKEHLVKADIGHFGLTLIRVSALKQIPHPWLHSQPGPSGLWDDDRIDADVNFWNKAQAAGLKLYCATRCVIGHMQHMVSWPGQDYKIVHQYAGKYFGDGNPPSEVIAAIKERLANGENHASGKIHSD